MFSFLSRLCGCTRDSPRDDRKTTPETDVEKAPEAPVSGPPPGGRRNLMKEPLEQEKLGPQKLTSVP